MSEEKPSQRHRILKAIRQAWNVEEEVGYDAPFTTLSWTEWLELQIQMQLCLVRFQRCIAQRQIRQALLIVWEMRDLIELLQAEGSAWIDTDKM
ncbi:hypothetical protein EPA93_03400 [Ktedonosporobacter rubrisoli]|uniref:Uncharacterized protein n=1 Tax=Ktedonosporobacter rubrisoli TaxID=2509675 RepID=A0A4P6JJ26_KTERU|nr:hypothetical protein [Ktedonosporobacter rubrisoli]QBD75089.1 hypothetical protein EPA93_03400 [Ktedonosporobacter rubrisoli]